MRLNRRLHALAAAAWLGSCGGLTADEENRSNGAAGNPPAGPVEVAAPGLPTDAEIAEALEGKVQKGISNPPEGVIPEPDGLRAVVRDVRCSRLAEGGSRTICTFKEARSPMRFTNHDEAAEWVSETGRWTASSATFVYESEAVGGLKTRGWRAL